MSRRNKLEKFAELSAFPNVIENFDVRNPKLTGEQGLSVERKGKWRSAQFGNDHPLVLELACGRGEYTLDLARKYPGTNFIGVDIKGARIWKGARTALSEKLSNAAFLRTRIEIIPEFFAEGEVDEIWITFPDPFLRKSKATRRLTSSAFLQRYRQILRKGGKIHLKTDEAQLFAFTLEVLSAESAFEVELASPDIYAGKLPHPDLEIQTYYERLHLEKGKTIKYIRFIFKD